MAVLNKTKLKNDLKKLLKFLSLATIVSFLIISLIFIFGKFVFSKFNLWEIVTFQTKYPLYEEAILNSFSLFGINLWFSNIIIILGTLLSFLGIAIFIKNTFKKEKSEKDLLFLSDMSFLIGFISIFYSFFSFLRVIGYGNESIKDLGITPVLLGITTVISSYFIIKFITSAKNSFSRDYLS